MDKSLFFSLVFFFSFAIYLFFGTYIIYMNPKAGMNRIFLGVCISLCLWSLGFSVATSAPTYEMCHMWRRVSALGWGSTYSLVLHFILLLTNKSCNREKWFLCALLHLPAAISIYAFALSSRITAGQYHLIKMSYGWINTSVENGWTTFFHVYYLSYMLASLVIVWRWRYKKDELITKNQSNLLFASIGIALFLGSLTDVILSRALKGPLPQMAPLFTLIPIACIYYLMRRYNLMKGNRVEDEDVILGIEARSKLHYYLAFSYFAGGVLCALSYFMPNMIQNKEDFNPMLRTGLFLFVFGAFLLITQLIKNRKVREYAVLFTMLASIPTVILQFVNYASVTAWVFPILLMTFSLVSATGIHLILIAAVSSVTLLLVWMTSPEVPVPLDQFDHLLRIGILAIFFLIGSFVNNSYIKRQKENVYQIHFQKLISKISSDFVNVKQANLEDKFYKILGLVGNFFEVDRACILLIDDDNQEMNYAYEWCSDGIPSLLREKVKLPKNVYPWWVKQLQDSKLVCIEDISELSAEASSEKKQLMLQGVKSTVGIAIEEEDQILGFIVLDSILSPKTWSAYHVELLKILSNLISDGIKKANTEKEIEYMAFYDHLTGLPNRTLFSDRLTQSIHLAKRSGTYVGVMFIDLDSFKMINDTMGHKGGDEILKKVAQKLMDSLRKTDTVARFGGDEFLILINNLEDFEDIITVANNIMTIFKQPFYLHEQEFFVTGSAGIAVHPLDGDDSETLIKNADIAMYTAKEKGKNQYALCTADMKEETKKNIKLSNHLYRALERNELLLHYQPQIKLSTGKITGFEALLRWNHPELGMVPPNTFIPLAEMNSTINGIGEWVLKTAIQQNKKWQDLGFPHLRMAVNLSLIQFNNPSFVDIIDNLLKSSGLDPKYLEVEITESVATREDANLINALNKLKDLGVLISIDDFGTEYSSLNRLKRLPIDRIKIDMQFVQGIDHSEKDQAITKVIINLAKSLGLQVLAEGVETLPQLDFLNQKMCDDVQGFYYYKPMPAAEIEKILLG